MNKTKVTAIVSKKVNSIWAGRGRLESINVERGLAFIQMETGLMAGMSGGFDLQGLAFKTKRIQENS